jgi:putative two-component system response regulator
MGPTCKVLLVGTDRSRLDGIARHVEEDGLHDTRIETDVDVAIQACRTFDPDIILAEAEPAGLDIPALAARLEREVTRDDFLPFVLISSPGRRISLHPQISPRLMVFRQDGENLEELDLLMRQLNALRQDRLRLLARLRADDARLLDVIATARQLARVAELRDHPDTGHVHRVGSLSGAIAEAMGLSLREVDLIRYAAPLHDIGQLKVAELIIEKDDLLTLEEMDLVKTHTELGATLLAENENDVLRCAKDIALYHHENWDGSGYMRGIDGEAIPLSARIVRVADTFDAMTHPWPFREPWREEGAIQLIRERSGRYFDPAVVNGFNKVIELQRSGAEA